MSRMSVHELERITGKKIIRPYRSLKGRQRDGITEPMKRKMHAIGLNVTGVRYKLEAIMAIDLKEALDAEQRAQKEGISSKKTYSKKPLYQVKMIREDGTICSREIFDNTISAEYYAAKKVPPELDCVIAEYTEKLYYVITTTPPRYFTDSVGATQIAKVTGTECILYARI